MGSAADSCCRRDGNEYRTWNNFPALGWPIGFTPSGMLAFEAKVDPIVVAEAGVLGPQFGERLAHQADRIFGSTASDLFATGGDCAITPLFAEEEKNPDRILEFAEAGVDAEVVAKGKPDSPSDLTGL